MRTRSGEKVIRPPMENVRAGKVFHPSPRYKLWLQTVLVVLGMYAMMVGVWLLGAYVMFMDEGNPQLFGIYLSTWWLPMNFWWWLVNALWLVPVMIAIPAYYRSISYSVISEEGQPMPEIFSRKGIINITERHIPFRTMTHISSRAGPLDRLLGLGSVEIETAGASMGYGGDIGPELKIQGIEFHEELRDFILVELRKYRGPYATATEVVQPQQETPLDGGRQVELIVSTLREIRDRLGLLEEIVDMLKNR